MATNTTTKYNSQMMGRFPVFNSGFQYLINGRYLVVSKFYVECTFVDLFHSKTQTLRFDFSSATIGGAPLTAKDYLIDSLFQLDMDTALLVFGSGDSTDFYIGVGNFDFERSLFVVKQTTLISTFGRLHCTWYPQSHPPALSKGFVLRGTYSFSRRLDHFVIEMRSDNQLTVSPLEVPSGMSVFGCFDGHLYGLSYDETTNNNDVNRPIDLIDFRLPNGKPSRKRTINDVNRPTDLIDFQLPNRKPTRTRTINWDVAKNVSLERINRYSGYACLIGKTLFARNECGEETEIVSLDLETLKWNSTDILLKNITKIRSDEKKALIVTTRAPLAPLHTIYRFVFNEPDELSTLVWLRLKRIFDDRPEAYEFILSKIPANYKQKCPLKLN
ncbi:hypothetical protein M3Y95_00553300 [Aphelenchoides besseyi]|nr:hypothetical protein M3Y95_00553300 [Aphelenchoides besseyi]